MDKFNNTLNQPTNTSSGLNMLKSVFSGKLLLGLIVIMILFSVIMPIFLYFILDIITIDTYNIVNQMSLQEYNIKFNSISVGDIMVNIPNIYMVLFILSVLVIFLLVVVLLYIYIKLKSSDNNSTLNLGFKLLKICFIAFIVLSILYSVPILLDVNTMATYINYIAENQLSIFDSVALSTGIYLQNIITIAFYIISAVFAVLYFSFMAKLSHSLMLISNNSKMYIKGVSFCGALNSLVAVFTGMIVFTVTLSSLIYLSDSSFIPQEILTYISTIQYTNIVTTFILFILLLSLLSGITICIAIFCYRYKSYAQTIINSNKKQKIL